jgi:Ig-like domain-containing protein
MRLIGIDGRIYAEQTEVVCFNANCSAKLATFIASMANIVEDVFFLDLQLIDSSNILCQNRYTFSRTANLAPFLACPSTKLSISSSGAENEQTLTVINRGDTAAMFVWIEDTRDLSNSGYAYFEDNYFCLLPNEFRKIPVLWKDVPMEEQKLEISAWNAEHILLDLSLQGDA